MHPFSVPEAFSPRDEYYMRRCLQLAQRGVTTPNPKVGCVIVDAKGRKIAEGYHTAAGQPHAEVMALQQAGEAARGATVYVNLEPCNHHGRTPPCTHALKKAGVHTVMCGTLDPNTQFSSGVAGSGRNTLQNARITVRTGLLEAECEALNAPFFYAMRTKRPYLTLKVALTVDGKLAPRGGQRHWLTGALAQQYTHQLRQHHEAILTTATTLLADNAQLTVRQWPGEPVRQPIRIILDRHNRLGCNDVLGELALWQTDASVHAPVWRVVSQRLQAKLEAQWQQTPLPDGQKVFFAPDTGTGLSMPQVLRQLGKAGLTSVFVEAGGELTGTLLSQGLVQELVTLQAPQLLLESGAVGLSAKGLVGASFGVMLDALPVHLTPLRQVVLGVDTATHWQPSVGERHAVQAVPLQTEALSPGV